MRLASLQLNPTVGDIDGNVKRILTAWEKAKEQGAAIACTSEMALTGYPPKDLLFSPAFLTAVAKALELLATATADGPWLLVGAPTLRSTAGGDRLGNAAVLLAKGIVQSDFHKMLLPTYDVFDEARYFTPGSCPGFFECEGKRFGVTICEDIWNDKQYWVHRRYDEDPVERLAGEGVDCLLNLSASPFCVGKAAVREDMIGSLARHYGLPVLYTNQVGGNDDLIFDGRSLAVNVEGVVLKRGKAFAKDVVVIELDELLEPPLHVHPVNRHHLKGLAEPAEEALDALTLGVADYAHKCGFKKALLGLSGGVDSALTAAIAVRALGADRVLGVLMPSPYSSEGSITDSLELAKRLGIATQTIPIGPLMRAFDSALAPAFKGLDPDVTEENIQSRIRGNLLMAMSNKFGSLLLTTGNKSEIAVGYCTLYGDMSGGLAVIADAPKTMVYALSAQINRVMDSPIPVSILTKEPSAELRADQRDVDSLPPYEELDAILKWRVEQQAGIEEIISRGFDRETVLKVVRLVRIAEFKRRQAAPGLKITDRAFGSGWRMPIAARQDV